MPYVRVTRDQRGYENTFLLHAPWPGARPQVIYWYRSAPGVRVGRAAFDEEAIRAIEDRHPGVDFDWPQLIEEASNIPPEIERRPERPRRGRVAEPPRRKAARAEADVVDVALPDVGVPPAIADVVVVEDVAPPEPGVTVEAMPIPESSEPSEEPRAQAPALPASARAGLLEQLVGREIATRLRARYEDVSARIAAADADDGARQAWQARADRLNPDGWTTPRDVLHGVEHADRLFDELRRELPDARADL